MLIPPKLFIPNRIKKAITIVYRRRRIYSKVGLFKLITYLLKEFYRDFCTLTVFVLYANDKCITFIERFKQCRPAIMRDLPINSF